MRQTQAAPRTVASTSRWGNKLLAVLNWASTNPLLTFFLVATVGEVILRSVKYSHGIHDRPDKCPRCQYDFDESEDG